jgi:5-carboxymethyl-2-hydroxymuconate isomerase
MPHIEIHHSNNIAHKDDPKVLLKKIHLLVEEKLHTDIKNCKSRVIEHGSFLVGRGEEGNGFVHLSIQILDGRSKEVKAELGKASLEILADHFIGENDNRNLQITVRIEEMDRAVYFKK